MAKSKSKAKDIVARTITIVDSKGKPRIFLGAPDDKSGYSTISLFGERDRVINITADHEGGVTINFLDNDGRSMGMGISADDRVGITLLDLPSGGHIQFGSDEPGMPSQIALYHRGKLHWTTRKLKRGKSAR